MFIIIKQYIQTGTYVISYQERRLTLFQWFVENLIRHVVNIKFSAAADFSSFSRSIHV